MIDASTIIMPKYLDEENELEESRTIVMRRSFDNEFDNDFRLNGRSWYRPSRGLIIGNSAAIRMNEYFPRKAWLDARVRRAGNTRCILAWNKITRVTLNPRVD